MQTHIIHCGYLRIRAEEMIKPLSLAQIRTWYDVDRNGYIKIAMNALLFIDGEQAVLIDPGCADFLPFRLAEEYGLENPVAIEERLERVGYSIEKITDVVFTHLHFDHGSGAFQRVPGNIVKRFPNANYHLLKAHYDHATHSNPEEGNSFFTSFLKYIEPVLWLEEWNQKSIEFRVFNGHSRNMVVPVIKAFETDIYFVTDLLPMEIFMESEVYSGYDQDPELARREKQEFLKGLGGTSRLIFFHDPLKESLFYP